MTIDELQERFNELRKRKFRTIADKCPVTFTGFDVGGYGPVLFVEITYPTFSRVLGIDPMILGERFKKRPLIEEVTPYADWPIDAMALFWNSGENKIKGHFAGVARNGKPTMFFLGMTSFTNNIPDAIIYEFAELVED
jgi:hypothetical protein